MKKIVVITAQGFEDEEVIYPVVRFFEEGWKIDIAIKDKNLVLGRFSFPIDYLIKNHATLVDTKDLNADNYDALFIPGGFEAPDRVRQIPEVLSFVKEMNARGKILTAICHGPWVFISAGIVKGKRMTCYQGMKDDLVNAGAAYIDEPVAEDGNVVTSRHPKDFGLFMKKVIGKINESNS
jgi:protease I